MMTFNVWRALIGGISQLQELKLIASHFDKNTFFIINIALTIQVFSAMVITRIYRGITTDNAVSPTNSKEVYTSILYLCNNFNNLADICNRSYKNYTPDNGLDH